MSSLRRGGTAMACALVAIGAVAACIEGCGGSGDDGGAPVTGDGGGDSTTLPPHGDDDAASADGANGDGATNDAGSHSDGATSDAGLAAGWLYTSGAKIYVSDGHGGGTPWMGRGVNVDDIYLCGFDNALQMAAPGTALQTIVTSAITDWKATFLRVSLGMASYPTTTSWVGGDAGQYKQPMTDVIDAIGTHPGVYVLVTLRSDGSMIGQDQTDGDPEATGVPSDSTTSPDKGKYPTGTDGTYVALVDSFATSSFVLFGITNEPGGNKQTNATIAAAMSHAVGVIRAEEDRLHVPHHLVSVQGNGWTSDISFYATTPLPYDDVVYEVHGYPPLPASYTYANIPVILGEYGTLSDANAFFADLESKQIPNLAWDFEPYSNCQPDLLQVSGTDTNLQPSTWGDTVKAYLANPP